MHIFKRKFTTVLTASKTPKTLVSVSVQLVAPGIQEYGTVVLWETRALFFCFFFPRWCHWMLFTHHVTLPAVNKNATSNGVLRRAQHGAGFYQYLHSTTRQITCSIARTLQAPMISIILSFPVLIICIRLHVSVLGPIAFSGWGIGCNSITSFLSVPLDSVPGCRMVYTLSHTICLKLINLNQSKIGSPSSPASPTHIS